MPRVEITLNGTDENPFLRFGLRQNPFPAIPKMELSRANRIIADLHANPIKDEADLRQRLQGCPPEFIDGCCQRFHKGEMTSFMIEWPD